MAALLTDEARDAGEAMAERTARRICKDHGRWSTFGKTKSRGEACSGRIVGHSTSERMKAHLVGGAQLRPAGEVDVGRGPSKRLRTSRSVQSAETHHVLAGNGIDPCSRMCPSVSCVRVSNQGRNPMSVSRLSVSLVGAFVALALAILMLAMAPQPASAATCFYPSGCGYGGLASGASAGYVYGHTGRGANYQITSTNVYAFNASSGTNKSIWRFFTNGVYNGNWTNNTQFFISPGWGAAQYLHGCTNNHSAGINVQCGTSW